MRVDGAALDRWIHEYDLIDEFADQSGSDATIAPFRESNQDINACGVRDLHLSGVVWVVGEIGCLDNTDIDGIDTDYVAIGLIFVVWLASDTRFPLSSNLFFCFLVGIPPTSNAVVQHPLHDVL